MFDFSKVTPNVVTIDYILSRIDQTTIWCYYWGVFKLGKAYTSKLRKDRNPSVMFYINKNGNITLRDFTTEERWDCFTYVKELFQFSYKQHALNKIASDFGLISNLSQVSEAIYKQSSSIDTDIKKNTLIQFIPDKWTKENLSYWRSYEINQQELSKENIYPVKKLFINKKEVFGDYDRYAYVVSYTDNNEDSKTGIKVLSPKDPNMKWMSSVPLTVVGDIDKLQYKSEMVLICKSKKDKIICSKLFPDVCWTQNESTGCFPIEEQQLLLNRFKKAILVWGADDQGVRECTKYNEKGFGYFNTPKEDYIKHGIEDPADYVKWYGLDALKELFIQKGLLTA